MDIWKNFKNRENHLILTGDFIHGMGMANDNSIEILESVKFHFENFKNFHVLLGNHEWSAISHTPVFKAGVNQSLTFEDLLKDRFGAEWRKYRDMYNEFFKTLPVAVKTANKVFISHAGPPRNVKSIDEIAHITDEGYATNRKLFEILWNRYGDYSEEDITYFLKIVGCNVLIVGHTPVDGVELLGKNQLVISSSYSSGKKAYVELDLEKEIITGKDALKMVKFLKI